MEPKLMLCSCGDTQEIDGPALAGATDMPVSPVHTHLCTVELPHLQAAMEAGDVVVACAQMRHVFEELAADISRPAPRTVDIRDRAGWSDDGGATAKMAALVAEAGLEADAPPTYDLESSGTCLVIGPADVAIPFAVNLKEDLAVTVVVSDGLPELVAPEAGFDIAAGRLRSATGAFTRFTVRFDAFSLLEPAGRGAPAFSPPQDGALSECDIIVDLTGAPALFPAPEKRDGYLRADPRDGRAVDRLLLQAARLRGTFERPLYVRLEESLCAHSRAGQPACSRCLNLCPTGAISPAGDTVAIEADICAGCGACAAACPSGAIGYEAPRVSAVFRRLQTLAETFRRADGAAPRLLVHDDFGGEMISLLARHGRGLPSD
ncbi:MAG: 4Fe-4S dicluster domain-containing protein, partial [Pseudomonadota bacterium]